MGIFDLKGSSGGSGWNYSDPQKPGYSDSLTGTVVEISNPQSINYVTKQPETWPDGNPKRNLRVAILTQDGEEKGWTFSPRSLAAKACADALDPGDVRANVQITELLGKNITVFTPAGVYNQAHPRNWRVTIIGEGDPNLVRGVVDLAQQADAAAHAPAQQAPAPQPSPQLSAAQARAAQALGFGGEEVPLSVYDHDIPF